MLAGQRTIARGAQVCDFAQQAGGVADILARFAQAEVLQASEAPAVFGRMAQRQLESLFGGQARGQEGPFSQRVAPVVAQPRRQAGGGVDGQRPLLDLVEGQVEGVRLHRQGLETRKGIGWRRRGRRRAPASEQGGQSGQAARHDQLTFRALVTDTS